MPTTFRPYQPEQGMLLPPDLRDWLPEGHLAHHVSDLVDGLDLAVFYERYEGDGRRKSPYEPPDDVEAADLRLCDGGCFVPGDGAEAGGGRGVPGVGGGQLSEPSDDMRVSAPTFVGVQAVVRGGGRPGAGDGRGELRQVVDRRDEGPGEREQAQGDELRSDGGRRNGVWRGDRGVGGAGAGDRRGGGCALWGGVSGDEMPGELRRREDRLAAIRAAKARLEARQRRRTRRGDGSPVRSATRRAGGPTSGNTANRTRRRRTTSRIRKAGS